MFYYLKGDLLENFDYFCKPEREYYTLLYIIRSDNY